MKKFAKQVIFYAALLGVWALVAKLRIWPPYLFPPPWGVGHALWDGFADHSFWIGIAVTMKRMLIGYSLSVVLGMNLGLAVSSNKFLEETVGGLLVSLQSLPSICWIPLAVLWFGLTEKAILFVVLMGSLLSHHRNRRMLRRQHQAEPRTGELVTKIDFGIFRGV